MTPLGPFSQRGGSAPSSRPQSLGGRVQRDVRMQAALALLIGIALVAVPLFIWGRAKKKGPGDGDGAASASYSDSTQTGLIYGDAGPMVSIDAGGRQVSFGEPRYLKCQDPGPTKTAPEKCDHLGAFEELVTKAIADHAMTCIPPVKSTATLNTVVDISFKKKHVRLVPGKEGTSFAPAVRKKILSCLEKNLGVANWDANHAHQHYVFQFTTSFGATAAAAPSTLQ